MLVGFHKLGFFGVTIPFAFNRTIQMKALESGALDEVMKVVTPGREMHHKEHSGFNFDIDASYNVERDCFMALAGLGRENPAAAALMSRAGLVTDVSKNSADQKFADCLLTTELNSVEHTPKLRACVQQVV